MTPADMLGHELQVAQVGPDMPLEPEVPQETRLDGAQLQALLPQLGARWNTPALAQSLSRCPEAQVHAFDELHACRVVASLVRPRLAHPGLFARVAAAHVLGEVYSAGARPVAALGLLGLPEFDSPGALLQALEGGLAQVCAVAEVEFSGVQVLPSPRLSCGLLALGLLHPRNLVHGTEPSSGDCILLSRPLGDALLARLQASGELAGHDVKAGQELLAQPQRCGPALDCLEGVHQVRRVGAGGLRACLARMLGPDTGARLERAALPLLPGLSLTAAEPDQLLQDVPCNGPLVVICAAASVTEVMSIFLQQGLGHGALVGEVVFQPGGGLELV